MTADNRRPTRLIFLIAAGLAVILVLLIIAWFGGTFLGNQYAQTKITEAIRRLNLERNVHYRDASYNVLTGGTVLRDEEIKLSASASPVKVAELRVDHFRRGNGTPMTANLTADNF